MSKPITHIAPHTHIQGDLRLDGPAVIAGHVHGNLTSTDALEIAPEAIIDGNIQATALTIDGTVKGNIVATQSCRLGPKARVAGDLCAGNLTMAQGARFIGQVCVGDDLAAAPSAEPTVDLARITSDAAQEADAIQLVEATIQRIEHTAANIEAQTAPVPATLTMPAMPEVTVLTQNVKATLQRAPRIIKAR